MNVDEYLFKVLLNSSISLLMLCLVALSTVESGLLTSPSNNFFFFVTEFCFCYPGWSAMARSRLTAASASWVQAIPLPQPQVAGITGTRHHAQLIFCIFSRDGVSPF